MQTDPTFDLEAVLPAERIRLVHLCAHLTGNREAAEDLAQETLITAWQQRHKLANPRGYAQWLSAIARNMCMRWTRRSGYDSARLACLDHTNDNDLADDVDLEVALERDELATLLDRALDLLPLHTREVLIQRYIEESPHAEIAARLRLSENAVAVRLHRGKLALRAVLATSLREEAVAYGLGQDDVQEWQETRICCPICGQRRLKGHMRVDTGELMLHCAQCCTLPQMYITNVTIPTLFRGIKGYRAALSRVLARADAYFNRPVQVPLSCLICGHPVMMRPERLTGAHPFLGSTYGMQFTCSHCNDSSTTMPCVLPLCSPTGQQFWQAHPRIRLLPTREIESGGVPALVTGFEAIDGRVRLEAVVTCDTFRLVDVYTS